MSLKKDVIMSICVFSLSNVLKVRKSEKQTDNLWIITGVDQSATNLLRPEEIVEHLFRASGLCLGVNQPTPRFPDSVFPAFYQ